jgi:crossover junction endodeoxyribonuclease RusA
MLTTLLMTKKISKANGLLRVDLQVSKPDKRIRDLDNLLKVVLDAITHAKVWDDDSQIADLRIRWRGPGETMTVTIEEIGDGRENKP